MSRLAAAATALARRLASTSDALSHLGWVREASTARGRVRRRRVPRRLFASVPLTAPRRATRPRRRRARTAGADA